MLDGESSPTHYAIPHSGSLGTSPSQEKFYHIHDIQATRNTAHEHGAECVVYDIYNSDIFTTLRDKLFMPRRK